jgi:hypothetical protein
METFLWKIFILHGVNDIRGRAAEERARQADCVLSILFLVAKSFNVFLDGVADRRELDPESRYF